MPFVNSNVTFATSPLKINSGAVMPKEALTTFQEYERGSFTLGEFCALKNPLGIERLTVPASKVALLVIVAVRPSALIVTALTACPPRVTSAKLPTTTAGSANGIVIVLRSITVEPTAGVTFSTAPISNGSASIVKETTIGSVFVGLFIILLPQEYVPAGIVNV